MIGHRPAELSIGRRLAEADDPHLAEFMSAVDGVTRPGTPGAGLGSIMAGPGGRHAFGRAHPEEARRRRVRARPHPALE
jgi:hypothetical protein